jgi:hypothetical protein
VGHGTTTYTLDYGRGNRILAEETVTGTLLYLYGRDCLGQYEGAEDEWLYYLNDATGYVRQGADEQGEVVSSWLFDPDGTMLEGPQGLVSHLICGGVYDWSTGLIFKGRGYFDPNLGIWLALVPLVMIQSWRGRKRKRRRGMPWYVVAIFVCVGVGGMLTGCGEDGNTLTPGDTPTSTEVCTDTPTPWAAPGTPPSATPGTPTPPTPTDPPTPPTPTPGPTPTEDDVIETARSAVGEVGPMMSEEEQNKFVVDVASWTWGDEANRDRALSAISWVVRNRVDSSLNFMCTTPAECARSRDFQGRDSAYQPSDHEKSVARLALEYQTEDLTNGAVYFFDFTMSAPSSYLARISNLDQMDSRVREIIKPPEVGFYFLSDEQWNAYYGTPTP